MRHALGLGRRTMGATGKNPAVGCVLVNGARVVGVGWTAEGGIPHAETEALRMAGDRARGATAYVTLEPCSHHGRTSPCAEALIAAGVERVVTAVEDPDPRVRGQGHARLRAAGIEVDTGILEAQARRDLAGFFSRMNRGRPYVVLKLAVSSDGMIAEARGPAHRDHRGRGQSAHPSHARRGRRHHGRRRNGEDGRSVSVLPSSRPRTSFARSRHRRRRLDRAGKLEARCGGAEPAAHRPHGEGCARQGRADNARR